jgi:hypothetical protein
MLVRFSLAASWFFHGFTMNEPSSLRAFQTAETMVIPGPAA